VTEKSAIDRPNDKVYSPMRVNVEIGQRNRSTDPTVFHTKNKKAIVMFGE